MQIFIVSSSTRGLGLTFRWLGIAMSQAVMEGKQLS
jgi:hypothetical protein